MFLQAGSRLSILVTSGSLSYFQPSSFSWVVSSEEFQSLPRMGLGRCVGWGVGVEMLASTHTCSILSGP